ncbi:MAG: SPFH domain-containing protein [Defluviitaleaceae bacterium]|nr:SPFH domain-containing protein [Defluviitaleaceae bacterium]
MGLIRAAGSAIGGTISDQWLEFFYQDSIPDTVLVTKGQKRVSGRSANRGNDNIISNGSGIAVADGQCMMIVEQGRVVEICAEPGQFTWDSSSEPSVFSGSLGTSIVDTFKTIGRRFAHGGETAKDQRVYYFNIKELINNKFGTSTPIPFRVVDTNIGLDIDISLRCNGVFSFKMANPLLFYTNVSGNVERDYTRDTLENQLRSEFISALKPAFARMSAMGMRYSAIPGHTTELSEAINAALSEQWGSLRGLEVISVAINSLSAPKEDEDMIKQLQRKAVMRDPGMAGAALVSAQADAMRSAGENPGGAMTGFLGMGMAQQAGGMNAQNFFAMNQQNQAAQQQAPPPTGASEGNNWSCPCGIANTGRFCSECGTPKPAEQNWACSCGTANTGRFCSECGTPRPANENWTCSCGTANTGRFCAECGKPRP